MSRTVKTMTAEEEESQRWYDDYFWSQGKGTRAEQARCLLPTLEPTPPPSAAAILSADPNRIVPNLPRSFSPLPPSPHCEYDTK